MAVGSPYDLNTKPRTENVSIAQFDMMTKRIEFLEEKVTELELKNANIVVNVNAIKEKTHLSSILPSLD